MATKAKFNVSNGGFFFFSLLFPLADENRKEECGCNWEPMQVEMRT
jgi:hypothetical protein